MKGRLASSSSTQSRHLGDAIGHGAQTDARDFEAGIAQTCRFHAVAFSNPAVFISRARWIESRELLELSPPSGILLGDGSFQPVGKHRLWQPWKALSAEPEAWFELDRAGRKLAVGGAWTIAESARLDRELNALELGGGDLAIDATQLSRLDSAGAWLLLRTRRATEAAGGKVSRFDVPDALSAADRKPQPGTQGGAVQVAHTARLSRASLQDRRAPPCMPATRASRCWDIWGA